MRKSQTVGFSIAPEDQDRLARLTDVFGGGNRSAFLRQALDVMERLDIAQRLGRLQAYGEERLAAADYREEDIPKLVGTVLENPDPEAIARAKLIVAGLRERPRLRRDDEPLGEAALAFSEAAEARD
jgi:hypothetical protein